jgi:ATP-dependent DNA helicase RecQ
MTQALGILKQYWHYESFRPGQEEIIQSVLNDQDTLALLPTGGGKSLCFQIPALARPGLCLVISPLIALMKDQVDHLRRKNITAFALSSGMSRKEVINTLRVAADSNCKFLYVSPERLETSLFLEYLPALHVNLIAVDEAHCVSQWGYDFRPPYLRIAALRKELPDVPLLALTASATPEVMEDIADKLQMQQPAVFRRPFTRPNLSYSVFSVDSRIDKITEIIQHVPGSSIVYCRSRQATVRLAEQLRGQGISAVAYHAGLSQEERSQRQEDWLKDRLNVIVCTNAFGMGIDKAAVRTVIHADPPESVENYYQEAGRAGRDGRKAYAVLLCQQDDRDRLAAMPELRYPPMEKIRPVYQALMNYLQLPAGSGAGNYYDFDLTGFVDRFNAASARFNASSGGQTGLSSSFSNNHPETNSNGNAGSSGREPDYPRLDTQMVLNAIRVLEQDGLLSFQQQVYLPARIRFVTGKQTLYEFESSQPGLEPIIHALLRNYEGIFDQPVPIREKNLAYLLRKDIQEVTNQLLQLHAYHIIDYTPQKDTPQLFFLRDRVKVEELYIDPVKYRERKEQFATRIHSMIRCMEQTVECRSRFLANYFGDRDAPDCGICDHCLRNKAKKK